MALTARKIRAAVWLGKQVPQWVATDRALTLIRNQVPGFDYESCRLKIVLINALYSTNVRATNQMAMHVAEVMRRRPRHPSAVFVERLANVQFRNGRRKLRSLASKFAHLFIGPEYPIMDSRAVRVLKAELGLPQGQPLTYGTFFANFQRLKTGLERKVTNRDIDRYLWLSDQYRAYREKRSDAKISEGARKLFRSRDRDIRAKLAVMMG